MPTGKACILIPAVGRISSGWGGFWHWANEQRNNTRMQVAQQKVNSTKSEEDESGTQMQWKV